MPVHDFSPDAARALAGPSWLVDRRVAAAEAFAAEPMPTTSAEEWRYSLIGDLDLGSFSPTGGLGDAPMPRLDIEPAALVRTVNGRIVAVDVDDELSAAGVYVGAARGSHRRRRAARVGRRRARATTSPASTMRSLRPRC